MFNPCKPKLAFVKRSSTHVHQDLHHSRSRYPQYLFPYPAPGGICRHLATNQNQVLFLRQKDVQVQPVIPRDRKHPSARVKDGSGTVLRVGQKVALPYSCCVFEVAGVLNICGKIVVHPENQTIKTSTVEADNTETATRWEGALPSFCPFHLLSVQNVYPSSRIDCLSFLIRYAFVARRS